ncbi:aminoacyl-tRNA hydrolase [Corynebacterium sp. CNCTC7651]|uniref:aminoacyl-tRNA hydrolase n=1 Tax=Corynebacterium sp. CNCTC7651 TaxID=2815361 RepID=UPI001F32F232|nr:aminoacyl-tRNA hydrolase [Corynebacterium sp. CNCTC7651]UIZ92790.1 aminoacyl-tRNA hydrolase [Corynebacterium sp. CNCTC7651]
MSDSPALIVGLGNPGPQYEATRHNAGVVVIQELCSRVTPMPALLSAHKRTNTEVAELAAGRLVPGRQVVLARTRAFMNLSGGPVKALMDYFRVAPGDLYVVYDELDLELGEVKLRLGGGDHGHNGLKSVTKSLGGKPYHKVAVGIGRPPGRMAPADYVLKPFGAKEQVDLAIAVADAADVLVGEVSR